MLRLNTIIMMLLEQVYLKNRLFTYLICFIFFFSCKDFEKESLSFINKDFENKLNEFIEKSEKDDYVLVYITNIRDVFDKETYPDENGVIIQFYETVPFSCSGFYKIVSYKRKKIIFYSQTDKLNYDSLVQIKDSLQIDCNDIVVTEQDVDLPYQMMYVYKKEVLYKLGE